MSPYQNFRILSQRKNLAKFICGVFVTCILLLSFLISCNPSKSVDPNTIVVGIETYPQALDPRRLTDALSSKMARLLYNGLFKLNESLEVVPDLAKEVRWPNNHTLEVTLHSPVYFHNGEKLTSKDILATYNSIIDPHLQSPHRSLFEQIEKMEALDEENMRFTLKQPFAPLMTSLAMAILPQSVAEGNFIPIGTGPYEFEDSREGEKIVLKRFDNFFGVKAKNKKLIFRTIYDDTLRTLELIKGRLDIVQNAIPYILLPAIQKEKRLIFRSSPGINFSYMGFNLKDPILKNLKVRQAIAYAINRDELIQYKLKNMATPATSLLFPDHWAFNKDIKPYEYNPQKAEQLLDEAGFVLPDHNGSQPRFKLIYKTSTKKDRVEMALLIAEHLKKVGIEVEVKPYEWGTLFRDIRTGNFQIYTLTWVGLTEPDIYYHAFDSTMIPPDGANRGYYTNPLLDQLLDQGRHSLDQGQRIKTYQEVQKIIFEDLPYVPLWYENNWVVMNHKLRLYQLRPDAGFQNLVEAHKE